MSAVREPRVAAVLVVSNGAEWLNSVLATLAAVRYSNLDLVVVDNGSRDGSAEILTRRIPADRLISLRRDAGFGRAVAAAAAHPAVTAADYVLLLHDDLVLAPDALDVLVAALEADSEIGVVGPKLREWSDEVVLAEVGMTIDRFGRAEPRVEPGELDQGQHDRQDEVLYVSTAGMLLRADVLRGTGGFDTRFPAFRDDLDLCWRAWLLGHRVEVVPDAVGYHVGAARVSRRFAASGASAARYLGERHALAAMFKNYGALRLAWIVPATVLLALGRIVLYLIIRRFGDAGAVVRAYVWNLAQLFRTMRRRRSVQRRREVGDGEIARLFAPGLPGLRTYAGAVGAWVAGGGTRALLDDEEEAPEDRLADRPVLRFLRDHPAAFGGLLLGVAYLVGLAPLLGSGQVVGGQVAPWPQTPAAFLAAYLSPFNGDPVGTIGFASPAQAVLGVLSLLGLGSPWLAQRLLVFGLVPLAWVLALRAGRLLTAQPGPRALGATVYAVSPALLGALGRGQYGLLVGAALLPGLLLAGVRAGDRRVAATSAWRAAALLALGLAVAVAAIPPLAPLLVGVLVGAIMGLAVAAARGRAGHGAGALRLSVAAVLALLVLAPWLYTLAASGSLAATLGAEDQVIALPIWRAITAVPAVLPGLSGVGGVVAALLSVAAILGALLLGLRRRPDAVAALVAVGGLSAIAAWAVARVELRWLWPPTLLLPTALGIAGLAVIATANLRTTLREYNFGARQLAIVVAGALFAVGLGSGVVRLLDGPYEGLARDPDLLPAFVAADVPRVGPYRVLVLAERDREVRWDVTAATGPSMLTYGTLASADLLATIDDAVAGVTGTDDPTRGATFGSVGIRYVVVPPGGDSPGLRDALRDQPLIEPLPAGGGRVYLVRSWLPRAVVLPGPTGQRLAETGELGDAAAAGEGGLPARGPGSYRGGPVPEGLLVLGEATSPQWEASVDGQALERADVPAVNAWRTPAGVSAAVGPATTALHRVVLALQLLVVLAILSLTLAPPGGAQRRERRRGGELPQSLRAAGGSDVEVST